MTEITELSKRVDAHHEDLRDLRRDMLGFIDEVTNLAREITVLNTSMAALQRRQIEKTATWSRMIEIVSAVSFVVSTAVALLVALH